MIARLVIEDLAVVRGERRLFEGLNLSLAAGEAVALTGPNGAGKTSLLRAVAGLIRPERGSITFMGENGGEAGPLDADEARSSGLHLLGHQDGLKTGRTAGEEFAFWGRWTGATRMAEAIAAFDLGPLLPLEVRKLSAGQRRRLTLARLAASPRALWLLDEPMAPLDAARRAQFGAAMGAHLAAGGMILAAVHDPLPVAARNLTIGAGA